MGSKTLLFMNRRDSDIALPPGAVAPPAEVTEEEMFSTVFNETVVRRFMRFIAPYKLMVTASFLAVMFFTASQISLPIIVQMTLDQEITFWGKGLQSLNAARLQLAPGMIYSQILLSQLHQDWMLITWCP